MQHVEERRMIKVGHSMAITLPPAWLHHCTAEAGDKVVVEVRGRNLLLKHLGKPRAVKERNAKPASGESAHL